MTSHIDVCCVKWGADPEYAKKGQTGLFQSRLVLQDEVLGLVNELIKREILNEREKDYEYVGYRKGFWIKVDVVEPDYIDNEKFIGGYKSDE